MTSIFDFIQKPIGQLVAFITATLLILLIVRTRTAETLWTMAGVIYILFILTNSLLIWKAEQPWLYFFISLGLSVLYILLISLITKAYEAVIHVHGSGESGMIFLVIIYHPVTLLLVVVAKWLFHKIF
jgi:hypothetical protein